MQINDIMTEVSLYDEIDGLNKRMNKIKTKLQKAETSCRVIEKDQELCAFYRDEIAALSHLMKWLISGFFMLLAGSVMMIPDEVRIIQCLHSLHKEGFDISGLTFGGLLTKAGVSWVFWVGAVLGILGSLGVIFYWIFMNRIPVTQKILTETENELSVREKRKEKMFSIIEADARCIDDDILALRAQFKKGNKALEDAKLRMERIFYKIDSLKNWGCIRYKGKI